MAKVLSWSRRTRRVRGPKQAMRMQCPLHRGRNRDQGVELLEEQDPALIPRANPRMVNLLRLPSPRPGRGPALGELHARRPHRDPQSARLHLAQNPMLRCTGMPLLRTNHKTTLRHREPLENDEEQMMRSQTGREGLLRVCPQSQMSQRRPSLTHHKRPKLTRYKLNANESAIDTLRVVRLSCSLTRLEFVLLS